MIVFQVIYPDNGETFRWVMPSHWPLERAAKMGTAYGVVLEIIGYQPGKGDLRSCA